MGRPSKYKPEYCEQLEKFFDIDPYREVIDVYTYKDGTTKETVKLLPNDMPFIRDFAKQIGVNVDTLYEWAKQHAEFSEALKAVKQLQEKILVINGLNGCYNSTFAIFTAKNVIGWRDQTHVDHTTKGKELPTPIYGGQSIPIQGHNGNKENIQSQEKN